jgi:tetratricopeptide (TPR) repeat protein
MPKHGEVMRKSFLSILAAFCVLASCSQTKSPTAQQQAMLQWNDARATVLVGLAEDQYQNGNFDKSRGTLDEAIKLEPDSATAHVLSAKLYIENGQLELAERELTVARQADPKCAEADYLSGVVYQRWQQPERALVFYQNACDKAPAELAYVMARAEMLVAMDRRDEALALLQAKINYFEHSGVIRDEAGLLLVQSGNYPQAIEMFRRASILAPDDLTIREHLASGLFYGRQYAESAMILSELLTHQKYDHRPELLMMLGECQLQTGKAGDAAQSFQQASDMEPDSSVAWLGLARAQVQLGSVRRGEYALNHCLAISDDNAQAHLLLGYLHLRESRFSDARDDFARASGLDPADTVSLCMFGLALDKLGQVRDAAACYEKALKIRPDDEMALRLLARLDQGQ